MQPRKSLVAWVVSLAFIGLACGSKGSAECDPGRACPTSCSADTDCAVDRREVCSSHLCGQRAATSTDYVVCSLDADCSRGDYCSLGACTHDCLADRQCTGGTVCSSRGRCIASADATKPPPVVAPAKATPTLSTGGKVAATNAALDFGARLAALTFTLSNAGRESFEYRLLSSRAWLSASPYQGSVAAGQSAEITVTLDRSRAAADGGQGGFIAVNTSAGYLRVDAAVSTELTGAWAGSLHVTDPVDLGEQQLVVNLKQVGSILVGFVDRERSPLYPMASAVSGTIFPGPDADVVSFGFDLAAAGGSALNPALPKVVVRHFTFNGKREGATKLAGTFQESFEGIRDDLQSALAGDAVFTVGGTYPEGELPDGDPGLVVTRAGNPMVDSVGLKAAYQSCTASSGIDSYLYAPGAVSFYAPFYNPGPSVPLSYSGIQGCVTGTCPQSYALGKLRCAQYWAWLGMVTDPTTSGGYLLDSLEVTADYALYLGNAYVAQAMDTWYDPLAPLQREVDYLAMAESIYVRGLHGPTASAATAVPNVPGDGYTALSGPVSLLDPFFVRVVSQMPAAALAAGGATSKLVGLGEAASYRSAGEPVRRALRAMEAGLFAASQRADRQRRMQKDADAAASVRTAAIRTWIDLAALAPVFSASAGTWPEDVAAVRAALREAVRRYRDIQQARNLFGYAPRYVPFLWSSTGEGSTNYAQIKHNADSNLVTWKTAYDSAQSAGRTFEQSANALVDDLYNQTRAMNLELNDICGGDVAGISECPVDVNDPQPRSQIGQQVLEIRAAALRIDSIDQQLANVREAVEIERRRAEDVAGADEEEYAFVLENGEKIYADDEAIRQIQAAQQAAHSFFGGVLSALSGGGWPAVAVGAVGAAVDEGAEQWRESYEKDKARRIALQSARPYRLAATIELRNSQAKMQTDWLQVYTLRIDLAIAAINLQQAVGRLKALHARAETLLAESARVNALHAQHAAYVLHYRVFAGAQQRTASAAFEDALKWSYLTVRAAEYQRTASCPYWNELWSVREPTALGGALSRVQNWSFWQQPAQGNRDVISIRDDILGMKLAVKDRTTGEEISPREQFRRFVADPANRNADGNFHVRFSTGDLANPVFSSQVCSDRIRSVSANLVGDSLGTGVTSAYLKLVQGGTTSLRACATGSDGTAPIIDYDMTANGNGPATARVYAAVNAPLDSATAFVPNVELQERAVLASSWDLVIDASDQKNGALDLLGLDDIQLVFVHESYTIQ